MSRQLKVLEIPLDQITDVLRGRKRIRNLPFDATVVGLHQTHKRVGICICSATYPHIPRGEQLPLAVAVVQKEAAADAMFHA